MDDHANHNSLTSPVDGCEQCQKEVFRRTHRCFGEGSSTTPVPVKVNENDE